MEEAKRGIRERKEKQLAQFGCICGVHFDTSAGVARHKALGCEPFPPAVEVPPMSSCPACGSYAVRRDAAGEIVCDTCGKWEA